MIREGSIRIPFRYAAGRAGSRFLVALRDQGRIVAARCAACGWVQVPPASWCPACGGADLAACEVGPEATVVCATSRADGAVFALLRVDRADALLLHRLIGAPVAAGARVRARFASQRRGAITDIEGFVAIAGGEP